MKKLLVLAAALAPWGAAAQDKRDDDIFGEDAKPAEPGKPAEPAPKSGLTTLEHQARALADTMQIGGRLEVRSTSSQAEHQRFQEGGFAPMKTADIYFDTRPSDEIRVFLRTRISEVGVDTIDATTGQLKRENQIQQNIDELWFKWDIDRTLFFTYGKQHVKWGSGRIWNPTDFTANQVRNPFDLFDYRLGQNMLKIHMPNEKLGFNYYAILQFDDAQRNDDIGWALRGEFAFLGSGELALSAQSRRTGPLRLGVDVSTALGPIDVNVEAAFSRNQPRTFFKDGLVEGNLVVPPEDYQDKDKQFKQVDAGISYGMKYSDDDSVYFGAEYFYNELGYDDRFHELYALFLGQSESLYAARRYVGGYIRLPNPGMWNKTSFYLTELSNLSDKTSTARLTGTWLIANYATFEAWLNRCVGDYGEFCFRVPDSLKAVASDPGFQAENPQAAIILANLPTTKTVFTAGVGLSINF